MDKTVEFEAPKDFSMPEGVKPGAEFTAVCDFRLKENGQICLIKLGDAKMPGYDGKIQTHAPGYGDYVKSMQTAEPGE